MRNPLPAGLLLTALLGISACSTSPSLSTYSFDQPHAIVVQLGSAFQHKVIVKEGESDSKTLHVYIEGDGRPWVTPTSKALDPSPKRAMMAQLMSLDTAPAIYLGRPCYFDTSDPHCSDSKWWTSHRYADDIVRSMNMALDALSTGYDAITLIGYSGGGTLAYLMATSRDDVDALVTMAANLNVALWTQQHGFSALRGSRDPASEPPLPADIRQLHLWGALDSNVSKEVLSSVVGHQGGAQLVVLNEVDHACCWAEQWPDFLRELE